MRCTSSLAFTSNNKRFCAASARVFFAHFYYYFFFLLSFLSRSRWYIRKMWRNQINAMWTRQKAYDTNAFIYLCTTGMALLATLWVDEYNEIVGIQQNGNSVRFRHQAALSGQSMMCEKRRRILNNFLYLSFTVIYSHIFLFFAFAENHIYGDYTGANAHHQPCQMRKDYEILCQCVCVHRPARSWENSFIVPCSGAFVCNE